MMRESGSLWRMPALIAMATLAGLLVALFSPPGPGRWVSWALLAIPTFIPLLFRRRRRATPDNS